MLTYLLCLLILAVSSAQQPNCDEPTEELKCHLPNEVSKCVYICPPEMTCSNRHIQFSCYRGENEKCTNKCVCKAGYYRNLIGECITEEQCDQCPQKHEYYSCGGACDNECETLHKYNQTHCHIINVKCNEMCYCEEGYARDENNKCIPIDQCKPPKCPGPNEYYTDCFITCPPEICMSLVAKYKCPAPKCTKGCKCDDGHLRLKAGKPCMPIHQCPQLANAS